MILRSPIEVVPYFKDTEVKNTFKTLFKRNESTANNFVTKCYLFARIISSYYRIFSYLIYKTIKLATFILMLGIAFNIDTLKEKKDKVYFR